MCSKLNMPKVLVFSSQLSLIFSSGLASEVRVGVFFLVAVALGLPALPSSCFVLPSACDLLACQGAEQNQQDDRHYNEHIQGKS